MRSLFAVAAVLLSAACDDAIACSELGCTDQAKVTVSRPDSAWEPGQYDLRFTVDGQTYSCPFEFPENLPTVGTWSQVPCQPASGTSSFFVDIQQEVTCTEERTGNAVSQSCQPIPERYTLHIVLPGNPASVALDLERDGLSFLSVAPTLDYADVQPNGPGCEPVCSQAQHDVVLR